MSREEQELLAASQRCYVTLHDVDAVLEEVANAQPSIPTHRLRLAREELATKALKVLATLDAERAVGREVEEALARAQAELSAVCEKAGRLPSG